MVYLFLGVFIISIMVTLINIYFAKLIDPTMLDLFKGAIYMLPLQFLVGVGFAFYYSQGIKIMSYATLTLAYYPINITMGLFVGIFIFKNHIFTMYEVAGIGFTMIGMGFFIANKITEGISI